MSKSINFIWYGDPVSGESNGHVMLWQAMNPSWQVHMWNLEESTAFMSQFRKWKPTWDHLVNQLRKAKSPKPLYGKMSDFFRLVLLWGSDHEISVYADDDMRPMRPLDDWMAETQWRDHVHRQKESFELPELKDAPWDGAKVLLTGENYNMRGPHLSVSNNFMMARPRSGFLEASINRGIHKRDAIVLNAFGPSMLTDSWWHFNDFWKTYGMRIIPWHYFNWIPKDMDPVPHPAWTCALHYQKLRWTDSTGVRAGASGESRGVKLA